MDWNHVNALLSTIHQAAAAGPKFSKYAAAAVDELEAVYAKANSPPEKAAKVDTPPELSTSPITSADEPSTEKV